MDFPEFIPPLIRTGITSYIEGNSWEPHGYASSLESAEFELAKLKKAIDARTRCGDLEYLDSLRPQLAIAQKHRDDLAEIIECLKRLGTRGEMKEVFSFLEKEELDDEKCWSFIRSAWAAQMDFGPYRDQLKSAKELTGQIAESAEKLAALIEKFAKVHHYGPSEFFSIQELLRTTDNNEMQDYNLLIWRSLREHVLGDYAPVDTSAADTNAKDLNEGAQNEVPITIRFIAPGDTLDTVDPADGVRATLRYAWEKAPAFPAMLNTVARVARNFKPSETGMVGAALGSRKHHLVNEYVRAFAHLLEDRYHFSLTPNVMHAMAIVAGVVLNQANSAPTVDDVRKTLKSENG